MKIYQIISRIKSESGHSFKVRLNPEHPVYRGHFPSRAVTPGVMIVSMVQDLVEEVKQETLELIAAKNIKFLNPMLPDENKIFKINFSVIKDQNEYQVKATATDGVVVYFKINATFETVN